MTYEFNPDCGCYRCTKQRGISKQDLLDRKDALRKEFNDLDDRKWDILRDMHKIDKLLEESKE